MSSYLQLLWLCEKCNPDHTPSCCHTHYCSEYSFKSLVKVQRERLLFTCLVSPVYAFSFSCLGYFLWVLPSSLQPFWFCRSLMLKSSCCCQRICKCFLSVLPASFQYLTDARVKTKWKDGNGNGNVNSVFCNQIIWWFLKITLTCLLQVTCVKMMF